MGAAENLGSQQKVQEEDLPTILLVDDHFVTADIERNYLSSVGFRVSLATSSAAAESLLKAQDIDLMIVDVNFSKEQGLRLVQVAKKVTRNKDLKIIVTSVVGLPAVRKSAEAAGADQFLLKPAPRPKVLKEIKKLTSQKARDTERVKQSLEIRYVCEGKPLVAKSLDVSSDGVHLKGAGHGSEDFRPTIGSKISMTFALGAKDKQIQVLGEVVRHTQEGFGVKFLELNMTASRQLDKFLLQFSMEHRASQFYL